MKEQKVRLIPKKNKAGRQKPSTVLALFAMLFFILSFGSIQGVLGKFLQRGERNDSAAAAKFSVVITAPEGFGQEQGAGPFDYRFLSGTEIVALIFQVHNNGETAVLCTPYIDGDVMYGIFVDGEELSQFVVNAKETVEFYLLLAPVGLDEKLKTAKFVVDIRQEEGMD